MRTEKSRRSRLQESVPQVASVIKKERQMRPYVNQWLAAHGLLGRFEWWCCGGICDMLGYRFAERTGRRVPALEDLVAVELKMSNVREVVWQCKDRLRAVRASYAGMPVRRVDRMREDTLDCFREPGVGLLAVHDDGRVEVRIEPRDSTQIVDWQREKMHKSLWRKHRNHGCEPAG